jgi:two-component system response regulator FixJ
VQTPVQNDRIAPPSAEPVHAYIVDDVAGDRTAAADLAVVAGMQVSLFEDGQTFIDALPNLVPGIVLLDVMMPVVNGSIVLDAIGKLGTGHVVIMMSSHSDVPTAVAMMRGGAHDFLLKPLGGSDTYATFERAANVLNDVKQASHHQAVILEQLRAITPKEMMVLRKLVAGKRNKNIAFELGVSERTVEVHRSRLIRRVEAATFAGLIAFAVKAGVEPDA